MPIISHLFCLQQIQILLPVAWYQFPSTFCMNRLIILSPTLDRTVRIFPRHQSTKKTMCV